VSETETVTVDIELTSPIERVWTALTDPAGFSRWMFFQADGFRPVVGHKFQFRSEAGPGWSGIVDAEVLTVDPPHHLSYTWVSGAVNTTVSWTLARRENGGTSLHLEQTGFAADAHRESGGAHYGWTKMLEQLQGVLASEQ
jgi:uncharacterized protein YndB with AHSA1/START domain